MKGNSFSEKLALLENLYKITDFSRLNTISEIGKLNKKFNGKLEVVLNIKNLFTFLENKYKLKSIFYSGNKKNNCKLWIYISEEQNVEENYYENIENILLKKFQKNKDFLFVIGQKAMEFARKINIDPILILTNNHEEATFLKSINNVILDFFLSEKVGEVIFLLNSNKISNSQLSVLPIKNMELNINQLNNLELIKNFEDKKIYPDILTSFEHLFNFYLSGIIPSLIYESRFFKFQQQLIKESKMLDEIENKINQLKKDYIKQKREELTEEMILISQTNQNNEGIDDE